MTMAGVKKIILSGIAWAAAVMLSPWPVLAVPAELQTMKELERASKESLPAEEAAFERPVMEYRSSQLKDPFESYIEETKPDDSKPEEPVSYTPPVLSLQGIVWGGKFPLAIINNKVVKAGNIIAEAKVLEISEGGVLVFFKGRQYEFAAPAAAAKKAMAQKAKGGPK
jgi:hypothetical protein